MVNIIGLMLATLGTVGVASIVGYIIWVKTRAKKMSWKAFVFQLSDAVYPPTLGRKGEVVSDLDLSDLKAFGTDTLVREDLDKGITVYRLSTLNKSTGDVTPDAVWNLPGVGKCVNVLYHGDSCTLLKGAYARKTGKMIWNPMPYDRTNALKNDIAIRKARIGKKKDVLAQLLPYVAIVVGIFGIIGLAYIAGDSFVKMSKEATKQAELLSEGEKHIADRLASIYGKPSVPGAGEGSLGPQPKEEPSEPAGEVPYIE